MSKPRHFTSRRFFRYELAAIALLKIILVLVIKYTYFSPHDHPKLPAEQVTDYVFSSPKGDATDAKIQLTLPKELSDD